MIIIKKNEAGKVLLLSSMLVLLSFGATIGWAAVHAILVKRMGVQYLPYTYMGMSVFCTLGSTIYMSLIDKFTRESLLRAFSLIAALMVLGSRALISNHADIHPQITWQIILFFALILTSQGICGSVLALQVWTIITDLFSPLQGKRLYPFFGTVGILGGILAGIALQKITFWFGMANLILVWGLLLLCMIPLTSICQKFYHGHLHSQRQKTKDKKIEVQVQDKQKERHYLLQLPLVRILGIITISFWLMGSLLDFQYTRIMNATFSSEAELGSFYGRYNIIINITNIVLQFVAGEKIIRYLGVFHGFLALALVALCGFSVLSFQFLFWTGLLFRYSWDLVGTVINGNAWQLSFSAFPIALRGKVRGLLDGVLGPFGGLLSGLFILCLQALITISPYFTSEIFNLTGVVLALLWLYVALIGNTYYVNSLISNSKALDKVSVIDALEAMEERKNQKIYQRIKEILMSKSDFYDTEIKIKAMAVLSKLDIIDGVRILIYFLSHQNTELKANAIAAISHFFRAEKKDIVFLHICKKIESCFKEDLSVDVRREAGRFLMTHLSPEEFESLIASIWKQDDEVGKIILIKAMSQWHVQLIDLILAEGLDDSSPFVRNETLLFLWNIPEFSDRCSEVLLKLLSSKDEINKQLALRSLILLKITSNVQSDYCLIVHELLSSDCYHTKCLAILAYLSMVDVTEYDKEGVVKEFFTVLMNPKYESHQKNDALFIFAKSKEELIDFILEKITELPIEQRQLMPDTLNQLGHIEAGTIGLSRPYFQHATLPAL